MARARKFPVLAREAAPAPPAKSSQAPRPENAQQFLPFEDSPSPPQIAGASATRRLWFCIYLPNLALEACGHGEAPLAVVEDQHGIHRVLLANSVAEAAGVMPGQSANAALALLPELILEERSTLAEQQVLESLASWLEQFSSFVSLARNDLLLLEVAGSTRLFGGLQSLRQQVSAGLKQQGFSALLAIAPTPLAATWLARGGRRVCIREAANVVPMLRKLPLSCLDWPPATAEALTGMGITNVADCLRLPREGFARRFGATRLLELDRALGRLPDPRPSWRAPEQFCADFEMAEEQSDAELLLAICKELLAAHEQFLLSRQLGTQRLGFSFYHLKSDATTLSLGCSAADRSAKRWSELLRIRFERLELPEPVIAVRLRGGSTQALQTGTARLAFDKRRPGAERHSMNQLAERLAARIGKQSVGGLSAVAEHRPQYAWRARNLFAHTVSEALALVKRGLKRPLWMLPEPALLHAEDGLPMHLGQLRIESGPERLETGWWDEAGMARDYYTAVNPRGMRLWIFRDRKRNAAVCWYLHGIFG